MIEDSRDFGFAIGLLIAFLLTGFIFAALT